MLDDLYDWTKWRDARDRMYARLCASELAHGLQIANLAHLMVSCQECAGKGKVEPTTSTVDRMPCGHSRDALAWYITKAFAAAGKDKP